MERITVTVIKWEKFNPRKDIKHPSWFAMSNRLIEDPDLFDFDPLEFKAYVYVLSQASQKNKPQVSVNFAHADRVANLPADVIFSACDKLVKIGVISIDEDPRTQSERIRTQTLRDTTDRQTEQDTADMTGQGASERARTRKPAARARAPGGGSHSKEAIAFYCDEWRARYGSNPDIRGKESGLISGLVKDLGLPRTKELIAAYLRMPDSWFVTKRHDVPTLSTNLTKVAHFITSGKVITLADVRQLESNVNTQNLLDMVERGDL